MKSILPIIMIAAGLGVFFLYVDPMYTNDIKPLKAQIAEYDAVIKSTTELISRRDVLNAQKNEIGDDKVALLQKVLPDTIDNVRLIIDLDDGIAKPLGLKLSGVSLSEVKTNNQALSAGAPRYDSVNVSFGVTASYSVFLRFLKNLEQSMRIVDVTGISFSSTPTGVYNYNVTLRTYWLK